MDLVPDELKILILSFLQVEDLLIISRISKFYNELLSTREGLQSIGLIIPICRCAETSLLLTAKIVNNYEYYRNNRMADYYRCYQVWDNNFGYPVASRNIILSNVGRISLQLIGLITGKTHQVYQRKRILVNHIPPEDWKVKFIYYCTIDNNFDIYKAKYTYKYYGSELTIHKTCMLDRRNRGLNRRRRLIILLVVVGK
jgi:hypothetical protein